MKLLLGQIVKMKVALNMRRRYVSLKKNTVSSNTVKNQVLIPCDILFFVIRKEGKVIAGV